MPMQQYGSGLSGLHIQRFKESVIYLKNLCNSIKEN